MVLVVLPLYSSLATRAISSWEDPILFPFHSDEVQTHFFHLPGECLNHQTTCYSVVGAFSTPATVQKRIQDLLGKREGI